MGIVRSLQFVGTLLIAGPIAMASLFNFYAGEYVYGGVLLAAAVGLVVVSEVVYVRLTDRTVGRVRRLSGYRPWRRFDGFQRFGGFRRSGSGSENGSGDGDEDEQGDAGGDQTDGIHVDVDGPDEESTDRESTAGDRVGDHADGDDDPDVYRGLE